MNKLKKIRTATFCIILVICLIAPIISNAANLTLEQVKARGKNAVGNTVSIGSGYSTGKHLYCLDYSQHWPTGQNMNIQSYIEIEGNVAKNASGTASAPNNLNGAIALAVNQSTGENPTSTCACGQHNHGFSKGQVIIWKYMKNWYNQVGYGLGVRCTIESPVSRCESIGNPLADAAAMNGVTDDTTVTKNATTVVASTFTADGEEWIEMGPYNYKFNGSVTGISLTDENGAAIASSNYKICGRNSAGGRTTLSTISSNSNFYIAVKMKKEYKKVNVKVSAKVSGTLYGARLWFLTTNSGQNLLLADPTHRTISNNYDFNFDVGLTQDITIEKENVNFHELKLKDVGFLIENSSIGKYLKKDDAGNISYVAKANATTFSTNGIGRIKVSGVLKGEYNFYEVVNNNPGYDPAPSTKIPFTALNQTFYTKDNNPKRVTIQIEKVDKDDNTIKMANVGFIVEKVGSGFIKSGGHTDSNDDKPVYGGTREEAMKDNNGVFFTGTDGIAKVYQVDKNSTYNFYEVINNNEGYAPEPLKPNDEDINRVTYMDPIENERKFVALSGMVWNDGGEDKATLRNNLLDSGDVGVPGVTVRIIKVDANGGKSVYATTTTSDGSDGKAIGTYRFDSVEIALINGEDSRVYLDDEKKDVVLSGADYRGCHCYIEFEYDGLTYQSVELVNDVNGTKAIEGDEVRKTFNNKFQRVQGYDTDTVDVLQGDATSTGKVNYELDFQSAKVKSTEGLNITADTERAGVMQVTFDRANPVTELTGFNLGIFERALIDLRTAQDLKETIVSIKGTNHLYKHGSKLGSDDDFTDEGWNVGVKWSNAQQPIYRADAVYKNEADSSQNLNVDLIYKIGLKNENARSDMTAKALEFVDYFDERYEIKGIGLGVDDSGNIQNAITDYTRSEGTGAYDKVTVNLGSGLALSKNTTSIYIKFALSRENVLDILNGGTNAMNSIAEITAYTTLAADGQNYYAAVDKDAVADNVDIFDAERKRYEDDTNDAPTLELVVSEHRTINGNVFEDYARQDLLNSNIREGDGEYKTNENEVPIANVKVQLKEKINGTWEVAENIEGENPQKCEMTTDEYGNYSFSGFTPGEYQVVFTWGDDNGYKVTDYKATIVNQEEYNHAYGNTTVNEYQHDSEHWYLDMLGLSNPADDKKSRATDDYDTRTKIDTEANTYTVGTAETPNGFNYTTHVNTHEMESYSAVMKFDVEYNKDILEALKYVEEENKVKFIVNGMNLGIIRRPIQQISVDKYVSDIRLSYENQEPIVDATIDQNANIGGIKPDHTKYMGQSTNRRMALIEVTLDNEIQGNAGIEVGYKYVINNEGELDYANEDFQKFGQTVLSGTNAATVQATLAKLTPSVILDYLGNASSFKVDDERNKVDSDYVWKIVEAGDLTSQSMVDPGVASSIGENQVYKAESTTELAPGGSQELEMVIEKRFTNNEDVLLTNQVEVARINKPFGSSIVNERLDEVEQTDNQRYIKGEITEYITPGNYKPALLSAGGIDTGDRGLELDEAIAERLIVVPSYGGDKNYTPYIVIALIALVGLAGGIYFITKKHKE